MRTWGLGHDNKFLKTHLARRRVLKRKEEAKSEGAKKRGSLNDRKSEKERTPERKRKKKERDQERQETETREEEEEKMGRKVGGTG